MSEQLIQLSEEQIFTLERQGCSSLDWSDILIAKEQNLSLFQNSHFNGKIQICLQSGEVETEQGIYKGNGIYNSTIINCNLSRNVRISNISNAIANYDIDSNVIIENCDSILVNSKSSFGNGVKVSVINEAGGREIPIYDKLSSQLAYIIANYRHDQKLISKLELMVAKYSESISSNRGIIGSGTVIRNTKKVVNVKVGPSARIDSVTLLENGSINSTSESPVDISRNVTARDFIICDGSQITDGVILDKCFVSQSVKISKQFTAENSVFFANSEMLQGEACSVFAGPYSVSHHKSTLLIAGMFSFYNAGSGTNQSNHMYKLGPVHQGVLERGSKTGSNSYILFPARIGPFTLIQGTHYSNPDTADLPFSYLLESQGKSVLLPGINLRTIGTCRDVKKWPKRDKRISGSKLDLICFDMLSPFTIGRILKGLDVISKLLDSTSEAKGGVIYNHVQIPHSALVRATNIYQAAIDMYLGQILIDKLLNDNINSLEALGSLLRNSDVAGRDRWIDLAGLLAPKQVIIDLLQKIKDGEFPNILEVEISFEQIYRNYHSLELSFANELSQKLFGHTLHELTVIDIDVTVRKWAAAVQMFSELCIEDAIKEFNCKSRISYGLDDIVYKDTDFAAVRGLSQFNSSIFDLKQLIENVKNDSIKAIQKLKTFI